MPPASAGRKGVSPLIAAVLLIGFTMAVAGIITAWVTTFTEEQTSTLGNQSEQLVGCSYAGMDVQDVTFDSANSQTDFNVENTGTVDFNNVSVVSFLGASIQSRTYLGNIEAGEVTSGTLSDTSTKPDKVRAASEDCPSVVSEETNVGTS